MLGLCAVSVPVTVALVLSATGSPALPSLGEVGARHAHATPAAAIADIRCTPARGYYALTFDGGPLPDATPTLVAAVRRAGAVATFFDVGLLAARSPRLLERQRGSGQVANGSYSGVRMTSLSRERRYQEMQLTARILDYPNALFRPPYGAADEAVEADVRRTGLEPVYWTVDTRDTGLSTREIVRRALTVTPGGIIRLHDGVAATVAALPRIVAGLRDRGLCPGLLARTSTTAHAPNGVGFHVAAVKP